MPLEHPLACPEALTPAPPTLPLPQAAAVSTPPEVSKVKSFLLHIFYGSTELSATRDTQGTDSAAPAHREFAVLLE